MYPFVKLCLSHSQHFKVFFSRGVWSFLGGESFCMRVLIPSNFVTKKREDEKREPFSLVQPGIFSWNPICQISFKLAHDHLSFRLHYTFMWTFLKDISNLESSGLYYTHNTVALIPPHCALNLCVV